MAAGLSFRARSARELAFSCFSLAHSIDGSLTLAREPDMKVWIGEEANGIQAETTIDLTAMRNSDGSRRIYAVRIALRRRWWHRKGAEMDLSNLELIARVAEKACVAVIDRPKDVHVREQLFNALAAV